MSLKQPLIVEPEDWSNLVVNPLILTSFQSNWDNINLAYSWQPALDLPPMSNSKHLISIPLNHQTRDEPVGNMEFITDEGSFVVSYHPKEYAQGPFSIMPANLVHGAHIDRDVQNIEVIHCYLEPSFVAQVAHESVNPDRVELSLMPKGNDLLIQQIGLALKASLEEARVGNRFYADAMATALAAHLIRHHSHRAYHFRKHEDGLPRRKLNQAIDYIQAHLDENVSLNDIASELGMSHYYFCRLFKQSMGMSAHQYLMRQRVERAKQLLKQPDRSITSIALDCGFANPSHFAKYFRKYTGMNPKEFRKL